MRHLENTGLFILSGFFFLFFRKLDYFFVCAFLLCLCLDILSIIQNQDPGKGKGKRKDGK